MRSKCAPCASDSWLYSVEEVRIDVFNLVSTRNSLQKASALLCQRSKLHAPGDRGSGDLVVKYICLSIEVREMGDAAVARDQRTGVSTWQRSSVEIMLYKGSSTISLPWSIHKPTMSSSVFEEGLRDQRRKMTQILENNTLSLQYWGRGVEVRHCSPTPGGSALTKTKGTFMRMSRTKSTNGPQACARH